MSDKNDNWFIAILSDIAKIQNVDLDFSRPNDVCEFLVPTKDFNDQEKISLYDLLNYITSEVRATLNMGIMLDMPYFIENATNAMNNKYKALARLECRLTGCNDEEILNELRHEDEEYVDGRFVECKKPKTLMDINLEEFKENSDNKLIEYIIELFKNEGLTNKEGIDGLHNLLNNNNNVENKGPHM